MPFSLYDQQSYQRCAIHFRLIEYSNNKKNMMKCNTTSYAWNTIRIFAPKEMDSLHFPMTKNKPQEGEWDQEIAIKRW